MLKIATQTGAADAGIAVLRLDGRVTGPWVEELRLACQQCLEASRNGSGRLMLDLAGVTFLGADGVHLFRQLAGYRVSFVNSSPFVSEQLRGIADVER